VAERPHESEIAKYFRPTTTKRKRFSLREGASEPVVPDASAISWQVVSSDEPVVTNNRDLRNVLRVSEAQIDSHWPSSVFAGSQASPISHAATFGTEVKHDPPTSSIGMRRTGDLDVGAFISIRPQRAVAATRRAITNRGRLRCSVEAPLNCTAVAGAVNDRRHIEPDRGHAAQRMRWVRSNDLLCVIARIEMLGVIDDTSVSGVWHRGHMRNPRQLCIHVIYEALAGVVYQFPPPHLHARFREPTDVRDLSAFVERAVKKAFLHETKRGLQQLNLLPPLQATRLPPPHRTSAPERIRRCCMELGGSPARV
jgi:hypothetical protein